MGQTQYLQNLRLLCKEYPSVAHICRKLRINRLQFNKYLSGQVKPSQHNQQKISDFFAVSVNDLNQPHTLFRDSIAKKSHSKATKSPICQFVDSLPSSANKLSRFAGAVFYLSDRIFIIETERLLKNGVAGTILYPSYRNRFRKCEVANQSSHL